jgi:acyl-CoA synthetase (NDP forming)
MTLAGTRPERVAAAIAALAADAETQAIVPVIGSSAQFRPHDAVAGIVQGRDAIRGTKPLAAFLVPEASASLRLLAEAGIPAFRTPESLADALRAFLDWRAPLAAPHVVAPDVVLPAAPDEADARALFAALGLPSHFVRFERPEEAPPDLAYPVALKILSPDIAHKSEVGGVALGLADARALRAEAMAMAARVRAARPSARITGFLAQPMARPLAEAILGFRRDPEVGPIVLLGAGGVLAELHRDVAVRLAPLHLDEARAMVTKVRALHVLTGWRGLPRGDTEALARAVVAFGHLAALDSVAEAEVNPLMIHESGLTVADAWVVRA